MPAKAKNVVMLKRDAIPKKKIGRPLGAVDTAPRKPNLVRELAQKHTERAIEILMEIAERSENDAARVSALKVILERGHGSVAMQAASDPKAALPPMMQVVFVGSDKLPGGDAAPGPVFDGHAVSVPQLPGPGRQVHDVEDDD